MVNFEKSNKSLIFFFFSGCELCKKFGLVNFAFNLFKYINEIDDQRLHAFRGGYLSHLVYIFFHLFLVEVKGVLLVEDRLDVLCVLAEDDGI